MASLLWTVLLVCLTAHWAEGALKELGEACTAASDTCVHPTLDTVCDQEKKCKIKYGQACDGAGHGTLCVAGAECTANTCTCKSGEYTNDASTGKCTAAEDKYGGACPSSGTGPCTGTNLECVSNFCLCTQSGGFKPDLSAGTCASEAAVKVGKKCADSSDCGTNTNLECIGSPLECTCKTGWAGPRGGDCAEIAQQLVGRTCTAGAATDADKCGPATTNLGCTGGTNNVECACATNYYGVTGGACYPANNKVGGGCSASTGCAATDANSECSGTPKKCQCKTGYIASSGTCDEIDQMKVGRTCDPSSTPEATTACGPPATTNLECSTDACACTSGFEGNAGEDCVVSQQKVGRTCTPDTATAADKCGTLSSTFLECTGDSNTTCACKSGYSGSKGAGCTEIGPLKVGKTCTPGDTSETDSFCGAPATTFLECKTGTTECACKSGYSGDKGGTCSLIEALRVGKLCTPGSASETDSFCGAPATTFLECKTGATECTCKSGYSGDKGGLCTVAAKRVGRACSGTTPAATDDTKCGTLATTHLECTGNTNTTCACKSGYTGSTGETCSKKSGAAGLVGSLVVVLLAAILPIYMRD